MADSPALFILFVLLAAAGMYLMWSYLRPNVQAEAQVEHRPPPSLSFEDFCARAELVPVGEPIFTKIRGVSYRNPDGVRRELLIQTRCRAGDALYLLRQPENKYDSNAIAVMRVVEGAGLKHIAATDQLGFLSRNLAADVAPEMDAGVLMAAEIKNITGDQEPDAPGEDDDYSAGVNIIVYRLRKQPP